MALLRLASRHPGTALLSFLQGFAGSLLIVGTAALA